jgi:hypothetical protein
VAAVVVLYVPAGHAALYLAPAEATKYPAGAGVQVSAPVAALKVPGSHATHSTPSALA